MTETHYTQEPAPMPEPAPAVNPKELRAAADDKAPLEYLEPALDEPLARVMEHGALKYGFRNYTDTPCKVRTYIGAVMRHLHAIRLGEDIDLDSGESHWAHIAACCAVVLGAESAGKLVDDRTAFSTPLSDRVHQDGDRDAKAFTALDWRATDADVIGALATNAETKIDAAIDRVNAKVARRLDTKGLVPQPAFHMFTDARRHYGKDVSLFYNAVKGWVPG